MNSNNINRRVNLNVNSEFLRVSSTYYYLITLSDTTTITLYSINPICAIYTSVSQNIKQNDFQSNKQHIYN